MLKQFKVFYTLEGFDTEPVIIHADTPEKAVHLLRIHYAGKQCIVKKTKRIKENKNDK